MTNYSSDNIELSKTQLSAITQSGGSMSEQDITVPHSGNPAKDKYYRIPNKKCLSILLDIGMNRANQK